MPALANTSSALKKPQLFTQKKLPTSKNSDISVSTRIDYNLRFTKQAVFVVASNSEQYSLLASDFLVNLSNAKQINVAFVSASEQLNDIQIRCRLIEQLFVNTLFDPEQSLAVSILRFAKVHGDVVSIVIDHAHSLSLQVKYELSQLVNLAKKNKLTINVVLFGLTKATHQLAINKSIFKNKMVVIDATSGQVISLDDKKLIEQNGRGSVTALQKLALLAVTLILVSILVWGYQLVTDNAGAEVYNNGQPSAGIKNSVDTPIQQIAQIAVPIDNVTRAMQKKEKAVRTSYASVTASIQAASSVEIKNAILALPEQSKSIIESAGSSDVLYALGSSDNMLAEKQNLTERDESPRQVSHLTDKGALIKSHTSNEQVTTNGGIIDQHYYFNQNIVHEQGYVIQVAGFSERVLWQRFIKNHANESLYSYQRKLNGQDFIVVTSKVYSNKTLAKTAIGLLPTSLNERNPWLKDISSVIKEINTFKE